VVRMTYRTHGGNSEYWDLRWANTTVDSSELNVEKYPGKYTTEIVNRTEGPLLDAGCGAGRALIFCHDLGREVVGIEYSQTAVNKIKTHRPEVDAQQGDIMNLAFPDQAFAGVMAFGLYHNLETGCDKALAETFRVMKPGGLLVASMRLNNLENRINDWIEDKKYKMSTEQAFHKANYTVSEFHKLLTNAEFVVERIDYMENMPLFYKFRIFRHADHKEFDERKGRAEGYKLNWLADKAQRFLSAGFPRSFCNIMVAIARRPEGWGR